MKAPDDTDNTSSAALESRKRCLEFSVLADVLFRNRGELAAFIACERKIGKVGLIYVENSEPGVLPAFRTYSSSVYFAAETRPRLDEEWEPIVNRAHSHVRDCPNDVVVLSRKVAMILPDFFDVIRREVERGVVPNPFLWLKDALEASNRIFETEIVRLSMCLLEKGPQFNNDQKGLMAFCKEELVKVLDRGDFFKFVVSRTTKTRFFVPLQKLDLDFVYPHVSRVMDFGKPQPNACFLFKSGEKCVGFLLATVSRRTENMYVICPEMNAKDGDSFVYIHLLLLGKNFRGSGYGSAIFVHIQWILQMACKDSRVHLMLEAMSDESESFWMKFGCKPLKNGILHKIL